MNADAPSLEDILLGALLTAGEPLSLARLAAMFDGESVTEDALRAILGSITARYEDGPIVLTEAAGGWRFQAHPRLAPWLRKLHGVETGRYSRAVMETLAIIAYRQPVTRAEIEEIRGVGLNPSVLRQLQDRAWVRVLGHRESPGRPALWGTTAGFLSHFGLRSLGELPALPGGLTGTFQLGGP